MKTHTKPSASSPIWPPRQFLVYSLRNPLNRIRSSSSAASRRTAASPSSEKVFMSDASARPASGVTKVKLVRCLAAER